MPFSAGGLSWWCWDGTRISERWSGCERGVDHQPEEPPPGPDPPPGLQPRRYRRGAGMFLGDGVKLLEEALKWGAPLEHGGVLGGAGRAGAPAGGADGPGAGGCDGLHLPHGVPPGGAVPVPDVGHAPRRPAWRAGAIWCWTVSRTRGTWAPSGAPPTPWRRTACSWSTDVPTPSAPRRCGPPWGPVSGCRCGRLDPEGLADLLERSGLPLYATALREDTEDIKTADLSRSAVVIGSEGRGVSPELLASEPAGPEDPHAAAVRVPERRRGRRGGAVGDGRG